MAFALLCIYMASLSLGYISPFLMQLHSLSLYAFVGVSALSILLRGRVVLTGYVKMYMAFAFLALVSCLYSINLSGSFSSIYSILVCFTVCFCATEVVQTEEHIKTVLAFFSIATFILVIVLVARGDIDLWGDWEYTGRFGNEVAGNSNTFATVYMFGASYSVYFIAYSKNKTKKLLYIAAFVAQLLALIVSGGRKYILVTALVFWLIFLFKSDKHNRKHYFIGTVIGIGILILLSWAFMNIPYLYYNIGHRFEAVFQENLQDVSVIRRGIMIQEGIQGWFEKPIFGHGADTFKYISVFGVYSHNNYVELLFNVGIIGALLYYGYSFILTFQLFKSKNTNNIKWILLMLCVAIFFYDYGAVSYYIVVHQVFLALCSRYLSLKEKSSETAQTENGRVLVSPALGRL